MLQEGTLMFDGRWSLFSFETRTTFDVTRRNTDVRWWMLRRQLFTCLFEKTREVHDQNVMFDVKDKTQLFDGR